MMYSVSFKGVCLLPAVPDTVARAREKLKLVCVGSKSASVKIRTQSSNEPAPSSTEVKLLSNPTVITELVIKL